MNEIAERSQHTQEFIKGIWKENPVFVAVLGLCPALAVTNSFINGLAMGSATFFVLVGSSTLGISYSAISFPSQCVFHYLF